jgi:glycine/D-amino acid oxidase-like deaminating enzyme
MLETQITGLVPADAEQHFHGAFVTAEDGELDPVRFLTGSRGHGGAARCATPRAQRAGVRALGRRAVGPCAPTRASCVRASSCSRPTRSRRGSCRRFAVIAPRRGQMLATAPLDVEVAPRPTYAHWGYQYWRQLPDRRLLIGGWRDVDLDNETGYGDQPTDTIQQAIERGLAELLPGGAPIEMRWAGTMAFARDGRPLVGWLDPEHHVAIAAGWTGHGMGMAAASTLDLADLLEMEARGRHRDVRSGTVHRAAQGRESLVELGASVGG